MCCMLWFVHLKQMKVPSPLRQQCLQHQSQMICILITVSSPEYSVYRYMYNHSLMGTLIGNPLNMTVLVFQTLAFHDQILTLQLNPLLSRNMEISFYSDFTTRETVYGE